MTNPFPLRSLATASVLIAALAATATAQVAPTARALGMGGAYVATARGQETLFLNPANLGLTGTPYWSVAIPQVVVGGGTVGPDLFETWDIVQASGEDPARRAELLALVPEAGMELALTARLPLISFQNRHLVFGAAYGAVVDHSLGKDLVDLFVNGYEPGRTDYQAGNTTGSRATYFDFAAGYGRRIGPLSIGATAHYYLGRTLSRFKLFEPRIDPSAETIEVEYREVLARGGNGYALDLGAAYQPIPDLTLSAVVANAVTEMRWNEELSTRGLVITQDDFGANTRHWEERLNDFSDDEHPVDPEGSPLSVYQTAEGLYDEAYFPTTLRMGAAYSLAPTRTQVEASYHRHLTDGRLGDAWSESLAIGVQQKLPLITLRLGAATDRADASLLSAGITLGALELGVARFEEGAQGGTTRSGWIGSFGLQIGTRTLMH